MHRIAMACITLLAACAAQAHAQAQVATAPASGRSPTGQLVYPARGQAAAQIDRDRFECHEWARQQSGFDPSQPVPAAVPAGTAPATPAGTGAVATAGLLKGAAGGAAVAELSDHDAGKGAAAGMLGASLRQQMQQRRALSQQQGAAAQQATQQQTARAQARSTYERGFAACMEARGYVVK